MIKIRYCDPNELSPGLHAAAEHHGRSTTVYLLCGLTAAERRAALRRLRLSARMGYCPRLPAVQLTLALFADRIRTSAGQAGAVFRSHPAGSTLPVMVVSAGAIAFMLFSTVSIRVLHQPQAAGQWPPPGPVPAVSTTAGPGPGPQSPAPGGPGRAGLPGRPGPAGRLGSGTGPVPPARAGSGGSSAFTTPAVSGSGTGTGPGAATGSGSAVGSVDGTGTTTSGSTGANGTGSTGANGTGSTGTGGSTTAGGNPGSSPAPALATTAPAPASTPAATPSSPAATPSSPAAPTGTAGANGGVCLDVGPLGICLDV